MSRLALPTRSFLCLRHGTTDWNRRGLFQGRTDVPLNDDGIAQAHLAARRLHGTTLDHIVSSPLIRALKTAEIVASSRSMPVAIDDDIIECDFGSLEGVSIDQAMAQNGITGMDELIGILPADGEAWAAVSARSLNCVSTWLDRNPDAEILFVCHDAVMQAMAQSLCGSFFHNRHGVPFRYVKMGDIWRLDEIG